MIILKLGGSLLTEKSREFSLRREVLSRVARELNEGRKDEKLILVQGGGSFGHPLARNYSLHEGLKQGSQIEGVVLTRLAMQTFNHEVVASLVETGMPAMGLDTASLFTTDDGEVESYPRDIVEGFLGMGIIPVLFGDVVLDRSRGISILSGDRIISSLAKDFPPGKIIFATDVDGIFTHHPKESDEGELIREVTPGNYSEIMSTLQPDEGDVTRGMGGKLEELVSMANQGHSSLIINALEEGRLKKTLLGHRVKGTLVRGGEYR